MRILLVMDPGILVPPKGYGGIERIVGLLAKEYAEKTGFDVIKGTDNKTASEVKPVEKPQVQQEYYNGSTGGWMG